MNTRLISLTALSLLTLSSVVQSGMPVTHAHATPPCQLVKQKPTCEKPAIDVVFVLDTTGSMSGLINAAKEKIWSIASTMAQTEPAPEIRIGLVAYRDRGDAYVTRITDLSTDLDSIYAQLMDFEAAGGGDTPESVNQALHDAVNRISWRNGDNVYKTIFLVGDAPPHMDYQDDVKYSRSLKKAFHKDIVVNTIQAGNQSSTRRVWQKIADLGEGDYFQVGQDNGNAIAISTPYDDEIANLSEELDKTRLYYGSKTDKAKAHRKLMATEKLHKEASVASLARRATYNMTASGKSNFVGDKELVDAVSSGTITLEEIKPEALPAPLAKLKPAEQKKMVMELSDKRRKLEKRVKLLAEKRNAYLRKAVESKSDSEDSLDAKIFGAIKEQAASKGLEYKDEDARY
jgi:Mg-chelatase subunit ChlD